MAINIKELKNGSAYIEDGEIYKCIENHQMKTGRLSGNYIVKRQNVRKGGIDTASYTPNGKVEIVQIDRKPMTFGWDEGDVYVFQDPQTWEETRIETFKLEKEKNFLVSGKEVLISMYENQVLGIEFKNQNEDYDVIETQPAVKGNTATSATKDATIETGYVIKVPLFITTGERVYVDTDTGEYKGRA